LIQSGSSATAERLDRDAIGSQEPSAPTEANRGWPHVRYKLHYEDGSEAGDAAYADYVNPGHELMLGAGRFVRVLDVVPIEDVEGSPYVALLKVEAA
jgi:hypothetical protein